MAIDLRVSSATSNGAATATSLGGYASSAAVSTTKHGFWDTVTATQNDTGHTDYRCVFVYNNTANVINNVTVSVSNKGGGSTVTVAVSSVATNTLAAYNTAVIANETTAPAITGSFASSASVGTLNPGQVRAVWLKRVTTAKVAASTGDTATIVAAGQEVVPA